MWPLCGARAASKGFAESLPSPLRGTWLEGRQEKTLPAARSNLEPKRAAASLGREICSWTICRWCLGPFSESPGFSSGTSPSVSRGLCF